MKIAVTAESTIDLPAVLLQKYEIATLPFSVILGGEEFKDGMVMPKDIFEYVEKKKVLPKTSAINEEQYKEFFEDQLKSSDAVVHISLSGEISSACSHAKAAAEKLDKVYVIDSKSLSTGIALLAIYARGLANQDLNIEEIVEKVESRVAAVQASFVIKKLDYLYKGGRCSALSLFGANLFQIRPQILLQGGKMKVHKKYRGNMDKVIVSYSKDLLVEFNTPDKSVVFITYTTASPEMIQATRKALQDYGFKEIYETVAGSTITSHCGESTLGILYFNDGDKQLKE